MRKCQYLLADKEDRTYTDLTPVDLLNLFSSSKVSQSERYNVDKQTNFRVVSSQLSPSTAVQSIVSNLFRQNVIPPPPPSKTNIGIQTGGKYNEESNYTNRINENASKSTAEKGRINSTSRTSTTLASSAGVDT